MERIPLLIGAPVGALFVTGSHGGGISGYWLVAGGAVSAAILWSTTRLAYRFNQLKPSDNLAEFVALATRGTSTTAEKLLPAVAAGATTLLMLVAGAAAGFALKVLWFLGAAHGA